MYRGDDILTHLMISKKGSDPSVPEGKTFQNYDEDEVLQSGVDRRRFEIVSAESR